MSSSVCDQPVADGPRRLSWGRSGSSRGSISGSTRPGTAMQQQQQQQHEQQQEQRHLLPLGCNLPYASAASCSSQIALQQQASVEPNWQQQDCVSELRAHEQKATAACSEVVQACHPEAEAQVRRAVLRGVLAEMLQEDGPQLDHYQLTVQAVAAVVRHKAAEAVRKAREEGIAAAAATAKQQLLSAQQEAEDKTHKLLEEANARAAADAARHSQEVTSLQSQLAAVQREKRQLFGKKAQQSREARQAAAAAQDSQGQLEQLKQQQQRLSKQIEVKDSALARSKSAHQQEVAALKAALTQAAAEHQQQSQQLEQQHTAQISSLKAELQAQTQQQLQAACRSHQRQQQLLEQQFVAAANEVIQQLQAELLSLQQHHETARATAHAAIWEALEQVVCNSSEARQQLQALHVELVAAKECMQNALSWGAEQHTWLQALQQQVMVLAPEGLQALKQQAETARQEHEAALHQLQEASLQLAVLQPAVLKLQQEKNALQQQLAAVEAAQASAEQHLDQQQQQAQQELQQQSTQLAKLQSELQSAQARVEEVLANQAAAAAAAAAETAAAAATREEELQLQQVPAVHMEQQLASLAAHHHQEMLQVLERLAWMCTSYFGRPALPASNTQLPAGDAGADVASGQAAAIAKLQQICTVACGDADDLMAKHQQYLQHKQELLANCSWVQEAVVTEHMTAGWPSDNTAAIGYAGNRHCRNHSGPSTCASDCAISDVVGSSADGSSTQCCSHGLQSVQQHLLQLEACLLQHVLNLQCITHALIQQSPAPLSTCSQRPSTAGSRSTDTCSVASSKGSSRSCDLTGQLVKEMAKEKRQLALELKKLQNKQQQWQGMHRGMRSSTGLDPGSSAVSLAVAAAATGANSAGCSTASTVPGSNPYTAGRMTQSQQSACEEVDEVLELLQGCQLVGTRGCCKNVSSPGTAVQLPAGQLAGATDQLGIRALGKCTTFSFGAHAPPAAAAGALLKKSTSITSISISPHKRGVASLNTLVRRQPEKPYSD